LGRSLADLNGDGLGTEGLAPHIHRDGFNDQVPGLVGLQPVRIDRQAAHAAIDYAELRRCAAAHNVKTLEGWQRGPRRIENRVSIDRDR